MAAQESANRPDHSRPVLMHGQKHVSLYLAIRVGKQRKMVYIPSELEQQVRDWVQSSQEIDRLLELVSQSCLEQLLRKKQEASEERQKSRPRKG